MRKCVRNLFWCLGFCLASNQLFAAFALEHWQTTGGAQVVFHQTMEVPVLDVRVVFAAGSAFDAEKFGLNALTLRLLNKGNQGDDADHVAEKFAETGAQYDSKSTHDMAILSLRTLTNPDTLQKVIQQLSVVIAHPDFPATAFTQEKQQQLMSIAAINDSPDELANEGFYRELYQNHPYAHPVNGDKLTLSRLTINDVRHFYQRYFVSRNATIVLVGAIDSATAHQVAEKLVHDLSQGQPAPTIPTATQLPAAMNIAIPYEASQTVLRIGQLGITHQNPDYFALQVGNYILGSPSLTSRLANEVRSKRGLTYSIYSQFSAMPGIGPFIISLSTRNSQAKTAGIITRDTLNEWVKNGPNDQELLVAKKYLTGSFPVTLANNHDVTDLLARVAFYHLPDDFLSTYTEHVNAVTVTQIREAFQKIIHPDKLLQLTVGPV